MHCHQVRYDITKDASGSDFSDCITSALDRVLIMYFLPFINYLFVLCRHAHFYLQYRIAKHIV